ncbi:hypothetical protein [Microbacterium sp. CJ88]|uniref:hypothetical protein n=1 Tax=Microbacterium sp. CJ88 TaxID=3445672 RepID=UPI003F656356
MSTNVDRPTGGIRSLEEDGVEALRAREAATSRMREALGDAWDQGYAAGRADAAQDGDTRNPYR